MLWKIGFRWRNKQSIRTCFSKILKQRIYRFSSLIAILHEVWLSKNSWSYLETSLKFHRTILKVHSRKIIFVKQSKFQFYKVWIKPYWRNNNITIQKYFSAYIIQKQLFADALQNRCSKNFTIFTGKHLCLSLFLIKLQAFGHVALLNRDSNSGIFLLILRNF